MQERGCSVGIFNDTVQSKARFKKVWRGKSSGVGVDATAYYGHLVIHGS
jgi:hypothetical protein